MWKIWTVLRLTLVKIYICSFCLLYVSIVYLFAQCLKNDFVLNGIVEIASVCLMPIEEDPSTVVLDDDK